jgi:hypothetical protein
LCFTKQLPTHLLLKIDSLCSCKDINLAAAGALRSRLVHRLHLLR